MISNTIKTGSRTMDARGLGLQRQGSQGGATTMVTLDETVGPHHTQGTAMAGAVVSLLTIYAMRSPGAHAEQH